MPIHQPILASCIVNSNTCSQVHIQIKHSLLHLQDLISTLAGVLYIIYILYQPIKVGIKSCKCNRECFICTCIWLHVFESTVKLTNTGWCIGISCEWPKLTTSFLTFYCDFYFIYKFYFLYTKLAIWFEI